MTAKGKSAANPTHSEALAQIALNNLPLSDGPTLRAKADEEYCA